jgi:REP element-mobilizing transposase RayT
MPGTYSQLLLHIVFATKSRTPWITPSLSARLYPYIGGIIRDRKGSLLESGGMPDHTHLLIRCHPNERVSELMQYVKGGSSKWVHETFPEHVDFAWQEGYAAFSVSTSQEPVVRAYIQNQERHHARRDFNAELRELLVAHRIEFEDRYAFV